MLCTLFSRIHFRTFGQKPIMKFECSNCAHSFPFVSILIYFYEYHIHAKSFRREAFSHSSDNIVIADKNSWYRYRGSIIWVRKLCTPNLQPSSYYSTSLVPSHPPHPPPSQLCLFNFLAFVIASLWYRKCGKCRIICFV